MIQATGDIGTHNLCYGIVKEGCIPEDWNSFAVLPIYKGYPMDCGSNGGIKIVVTCYERTVYGNSNGFEVKVGMHQGSALSPLLFVIFMKTLSREFRVGVPWELLYADDLIVIAETEDDLIKRLNEWTDFVGE